MGANRLKAKLEHGDATFGGWCVTPSAFGAELIAAAGFDYVCVDCQHGLIHFDAMWPMIQAMGSTEATPIVRIPSNETAWVGKALDAGAHGVIVPMVETREAAEQAAAACRYSPEGVRSFGPVRAGMFLGRDPETVNREVLCLVMIETLNGVTMADQICSTPGVDGIYIGPADLALTMGLTPANMGKSKEHADAIEEVRQACDRYGVVAGIHANGGEAARERAKCGFRMCSLATDAVLLERVARRELADARGAGEVASLDDAYS